MDFITLWKASSIILTGCFGILGLLKDFKDKATGHVTKWGRISLAGILLSTSFGVIAQLKESSRQQKASEATAKEALALANKTERTVQDLRRLLSLLEEPKVSFAFDVDCAEPEYKTICSYMRTDRTEVEFWEKWPYAISGKVLIGITLNFFRDANDANAFIASREVGPDLVLDVIAVNYGKNPSLILWRWTQTPILIITPVAPGIENRSAKITSITDFSESVVIIEVPAELPGLTPTSFELSTKRGQSVSLRQFERIDFRGGVAYRGVFPPSAATQE